MSILFRHSCFVHIPRTGGTWLQNAVLWADVKCNILKGDIDSHLPFSQLPPVWQSKLSFSFVREPLSWVRSRWSHLMEHKLLDDYRHYGIHRMFDELAKDTFEGTVRAILEECPGLVHTTYDHMLDGVGTIYQTESLPRSFLDDFCQVEELSMQQRSTMLVEPSCNGTSKLDHWKGLLSLPPSLESEFLESEQGATSIWNNAVK